MTEKRHSSPHGSKRSLFSILNIVVALLSIVDSRFYDRLVATLNEKRKCDFVDLISILIFLCRASECDYDSIVLYLPI